MAIATRQVRDSRVMIRKIADLKFLVIASPKYALASGLPQMPDEVLRHDCLIHSNYPVWQIRDNARVHKLKVTHPVYVTNSYLTLYKAALAGRGLAMVPRGPPWPTFVATRSLKCYLHSRYLRVRSTRSTRQAATRWRGSRSSSTSSSSGFANIHCSPTILRPRLARWAGPIRTDTRTAGQPHSYLL